MICKRHGVLPDSDFLIRKKGNRSGLCAVCERSDSRARRKSAYADSSTKIKDQNKSWRIRNAAQKTVTQIQPIVSIFKLEKIDSDRVIVDRLRTAGYIPKIESVSAIYDRLSKSPLKNPLPQSYVGLNYLDNIFIHRFVAKTEGLKSFHDSFYDDQDILEIIRYIEKTDRVPTNDLIIRNLKFNTGIPSHFFPDSAAAILNGFASDKDVLDSFAGWGGRTLGAVCSKIKSFTAIDLQIKSIEGCQKVISDFSPFSAPDKFQFMCEDSLKFMNSTDRSFDLIFTSPPFLDTEDYGNGTRRSAREWSQSFAVPFAAGCKKVLRTGGLAIVHAQDRPKMPVLSTIIASFMATGFQIHSEFQYGKKPGQLVIAFILP